MWKSMLNEARDVVWFASGRRVSAVDVAIAVVVAAR